MTAPVTDPCELSNSDSWADLQVLLANCLKYPDDTLRRAVEDGSLEERFHTLTETLGIEPEGHLPANAAGNLTEQYESLFGAYRTPFAPPAASPYKEWHREDKGGLMDGPPAVRMQDRYEAIGESIPDAYPPDHVALQLEYSSLLTEAEADQKLNAFVETELDWIDAFAILVSEAAADAPLYRWCVDQLVLVVECLRETLRITEPSRQEIEEMTERVRPNVT